MRIGFFTVYRKDPQHYVLAELMIRSIRHTMPNVEIVQFSDETSPPVLGVDRVLRKPNGPMLEVRLQHYAECQGDWLLLDTDTIVQTAVRNVFTDTRFDIAIADRNWAHAPNDEKFLQEMPWNTGVVFSRSPAFWQDVLQRWQALPPDQRDWLSEQRVAALAITSGKYQVKVLPGEIYNYPPDATHPGPNAAILHFKGPRKALMRERGAFMTSHAPAVSPSIPVPPPTPSLAGPLSVYIGYDPRQPIAFHVAAHSVTTRASKPVAIVRLQLNQLPIARRGLTEFTYSRFLVPHLSGYQGWSVFLDADMLCLDDIYELVSLAQKNAPAPVHVVKHPEKRFEWASLMVFDNARCTNLTPEFVSNPKEPMFDLAWAGQPGKLPSSWNFLVGYDKHYGFAHGEEVTPNLVHYTQGIPKWAQTDGCDYSRQWHREHAELIHSVSFEELMGKSVHVKHMKPAGFNGPMQAGVPA